LAWRLPGSVDRSRFLRDITPRNARPSKLGCAPLVAACAAAARMASGIVAQRLAACVNAQRGSTKNVGARWISRCGSSGAHGGKRAAYLAYFRVLNARHIAAPTLRLSFRYSLLKTARHAASSAALISWTHQQQHHSNSIAARRGTASAAARQAQAAAAIIGISLFAHSLHRALPLLGPLSRANAPPLLRTRIISHLWVRAS